MIVSPDHIHKLYAFTKAHFVTHYDVQTELVDHLANGIENQWKENKNLTFEEALNFEFNKFGIFGFQGVIAQKQNAMSKRYRAILWRFFREWFQWPKIIRLIISVLGVFTVLRVLNKYETKPTVIVAAITLFFCGLLGYLFRTRAARKHKMEKEGRIYMLGEMIYSFGNSFFVILLFMNIGNTLSAFAPSIFYSVIFDVVCSVVVVGVSVLLYVGLQVLPARADALLSETYPELRRAKGVTNF